jgi:CubicO group peptidase (beta-lactamase class C family)
MSGSQGREGQARIAALLVALSLPLAPALAGPETLEDRFASFNKINQVRDVDWYSPTEIAQGKPRTAIVVAEPGLRSIKADALDQAINYVDSQGTVALLVWQGGKLQLAHYGAGSGPATYTDTASMHKSVMAILYGAALRDGFIRSIDQKLADFLPEWADDPRGQITLRDLLTMTSGLDNSFGGYAITAPSIKLVLSTDITEAALSRPASGPPDAEFDYNNANSEILGIILQRATGSRYADYLSKTLLQPIGAGDGKVWLDHPGGMAHSFCCLQLLPEDWLRIGLLIKDMGKANGHQVIPQSWISAMIAPSPQNPNYGLHVWLASPHLAERRYNNRSPFKIPARDAFLAEDMVYFDGWGAQRVYISRAADLVIVRIGDVAPNWDDSLLPNIILRGLARDAKK